MLDGHSECSNKAEGICDFDLQMCEDEDAITDFLEIEEAEFKQKVKEWKDNYSKGQKKAKQEKEEKEKKLNDDDWICSNCETLNKMIPNKYETCLCKKCYLKNTVIEYML